MSAGIYTFDKVVALQKEWHGQEEIVWPEINFDNSGLNWEVVSFPVFVNGKSVAGFKAVVRKDLGLVLNIARDSYTEIQNSRVWEVIQNSLAGINHTIRVTGSIENCRKVFISIALNEKQDYLVNRDVFQNYLTFVTSHDGKINFEAYDTSIRVCCKNTLNWSRKQKGILNLRVRHSKNNELRIQDMEANLEELFKKREEYYTSLEYLTSKPMTLEQANKILTGFVCQKNAELSTRASNMVDTMSGLFVHGHGNSGQTRYDLLNAVTEFYTHESHSDNQKQFLSSEFGGGSEKKLEFYDLLFSDEELDRLAKHGEKLLTVKKTETEVVAK